MFKFLLPILLLFSPSAHATDTTDCGRVEGKNPYGYCITTTSGSLNNDVLYVLHGAGGDGKGDWWSTDPALDGLKATWKSLGHQAPRVIEVSFGPVWLLVPQTTNRKSGLLEFFTDEVMPLMESKLSSTVKFRRLLGHSMGGLNATTLVMHRPELFRSAALLAPAYLGISPYADRATQTQYESSRGMSHDSARGVMSIARAFVDNDEQWRNFSPTIAGAWMLNSKSPALYVSAGKKDLLFYEEARIFAGLAEKTGAQVIWDSHEGNHGQLKAEAIAQFLML